MSITKSAVTKNAACNSVVDRIDLGSSRSYGTLNILTADSTTITTLRLTYPAFADATDGTAVASLIYDNTAFMDGTAALFGFYDRDSTYVWGGNITGPSGGGTLELSSVIIPLDTTVSITSAKYIVP